MVVGEPTAPAPDFRDERLDFVAGTGEAVRNRRGRPKRALGDERLAEVVRMYFIEKLSMRRIADIVGVSHMSVYRMLSDPALELLI